MDVVKLIANILLILTSIVVVVAILLQPSKSEGMGGVLGGSSETFFSKNMSSTFENKMALVTKIGAGIVAVLSVALVLLG